MQIDAVRVIDSHDASRMAYTRQLIFVMRLLTPDVATVSGVSRDDMDSASLLNRLLYEYGERLSGKQFLNPQALAAYEAHVAVWRRIPPGETWLILEDDALVTADTVRDIHALEASVREKVDYVNLRPLHPAVGAVASNASELLQECPPDVRQCHNLGQVAYILTHEGALKLLRHALPPEVPIDWYTDSLRAFIDPSFRHTFTRRHYFGHGGRVSLINHHCLTCKLPRSDQEIITSAARVTLVLLAAGVGWTLHRRRSSHAKRIPE